MADSATNKRTDTIDSVQSDQYLFPYHYIPSSTTYPKFSRNWGYSPSYLAAINLVKAWFMSLLGGADGSHHRHIDYGCGDGGFLHALQKGNEFHSVQFEGIDFDKRAIAWAELFFDGQPNTTFICGDLHDLPPKSYDTGTLIEVLEHVPPEEVPLFISGVSAALKKKGILYVTVPSTEKPTGKKHYRHFDYQSLIECFEKDFDVVEQFAFEKISRLSRFLKRIMMRKKLYIEASVTSDFFIKECERKHQDLTGCGRIGLILRKK